MLRDGRIESDSAGVSRDERVPARRNLGRNRRRTALSLAGVAAGTAALLLTAGFVVFSFRGLSEAMIHGVSGISRWPAPRWRRRRPLERPLAPA